MKGKKRFIATLILNLIAVLSINAQTQTIRGNISDIDSDFQLPGVNVIILNSEPMLATTTDVSGNFKLENVPYGRVNIEFSFIGYEYKVVPNVLVSSGKEVVLNIKLSESVVTLSDASVVAESDKAKALNEMSQISARTVSVEETKRYAGAIDDPARMVSAYAGVNIDAQGNNDIIVRGNSSRGILWRLEGVEIPNPNHFAGDGGTGGPINALNSAMLDNSDFLTGAFTAEYGNATAGVFDMNLRKGNNQKSEQSASIGILGTDLTAEGPFSKNYSGSYLANYRYSTLAILDDLGVVDFGGVPEYQDASFKVYLPVGEKHFFTLFGLGGLSNISGTEEDEDDEERILEKFNQTADLGVLGLNHTYFLNNNVYLKTQLNVAATRKSTDFSLLDDDDASFYLGGDNSLTNTTLRGATTLNYKLNARHKLKTGLIFSTRTYDFQAREHNFETGALDTTLESSGEASTVQAFATWKYRLSDKVSMVSGVHYFEFLLNNKSAIEPRWSVNCDLNKKHSVFAGMGLHSKHESISTYTAQVPDENAGFTQPNRDLDLTKSAHFVAGYSTKIGSLTNVKAEVYYQHLYDVPVSTGLDSTWSMINSIEYFINDKLENTGTGKNYGLELTIERFFKKGFYYLTSISLYNSEYKAKDGVWRDTRFNGNYVVNFLTGKEFSVGKEAKQKTMFVNIKTALVGGRRYTPIDLESSIALGNEVSFSGNPFANQSDDVFKLDFAFGIRRNWKKISTEWKIDIQNTSNNAAVVDYYYNRDKESIEESTQLSLLPVMSYRINF